MLLATLQQNFQSLGNVTHSCNLCYNVKLRLLMESLLASSNTFLTIVARQVAINVAQCNRSRNVQFVSQTFVRQVARKIVLCNRGLRNRNSDYADHFLTIWPICLFPDLPCQQWPQQHRFTRSPTRYPRALHQNQALHVVRTHLNEVRGLWTKARWDKPANWCVHHMYGSQ